MANSSVYVPRTPETPLSAPSLLVGLTLPTETLNQEGVESICIGLFDRMSEQNGATAALTETMNRIRNLAQDGCKVPNSYQEILEYITEPTVTFMSDIKKLSDVGSAHREQTRNALIPNWEHDMSNCLEILVALAVFTDSRAIAPKS